MLLRTCQAATRRRVVRPARNSLHASSATRLFSVVSINSSFPATLLRYNSKQKSNLFDFKKGGHDAHYDGVEVSSDGLVYPAVSKNIPFSNGATLMPNTFMMQEIIRTFYDYYIDDVEDGKVMESPIVYRIPKGTPIPRGLILLHEHTSQFSLQPSRPVPISHLNHLLDDFYFNHAEMMTAEQWLDENAFSSAVADDAMLEWMAK